MRAGMERDRRGLGAEHRLGGLCFLQAGNEIKFFEYKEAPLPTGLQFTFA